jgi:FAD/FMN-containing dehydrogenase
LDHLFIGSEGTLGIICEATLQVPVKPKSVNVILLCLDSFEKIASLFQFCKENIGNILSAFEFFDTESLDTVLNNLNNVNNPFDQKYNFYVLIETHGSDPEYDGKILLNFLESLLSNQELVKDGTMASVIYHYNC